MDRAKKGEISLLFLDASRFVMGRDFLGYIYGRTRRFVKTFSGRGRYNVLGALDFISKKVTIVTNDCYITACEVCEVFRKIAEVYAGKTVFVVLDNAKYQMKIPLGATKKPPKYLVNVSTLQYNIKP
jgi:hypothetical protein